MQTITALACREARIFSKMPGLFGCQTQQIGPLPHYWTQVLSGTRFHIFILPPDMFFCSTDNSEATPACQGCQQNYVCYGLCISARAALHPNEILMPCAVTRGPSNGYGKLPPPTYVLRLIHYYSVLLFLYYLTVLSIHQRCGANGNSTLCPRAHKKPQTMQLLH